MRLAIFNHHAELVGGVEAYLNHLLPSLISRGHEVCYVHELTASRKTHLMKMPPGVTVLDIALLGWPKVREQLREWKVEMLYAHWVESAEVEEWITSGAGAPAILFTHAYYGTCISGTRTWQTPSIKSCNKPFNATCLLHYYPHRCGGWNPITMFRRYQAESEKLKRIRKYQRILTHSNHMLNSYQKQGVDKVFRMPYPVQSFQEACARSAPRAACSILFLGRMDRLKGGDMLLNSLQTLHAALGRPILVTMAGDGVERHAWEALGQEITAANPEIIVKFPGWIERKALPGLFTQHDLIVMPSIWPEPFGQIGLEAAQFGLPTVAFAVGGIPDWIAHGVSGVLVDAHPPKPAKLAQGIVSALDRPEDYERLSAGAAAMVSHFSVEMHLTALEEHFAAVKKGAHV